MTKLSEMNKSRPDPKNFKILRIEEILAIGNVWITEPKWTVVEVIYPDVEHLGGKKILVFVGDIREWLEHTDFIDPHFDTGPHAPVARFSPVQNGWENARSVCNI